MAPIRSMPFLPALIIALLLSWPPALAQYVVQTSDDLARRRTVSHDGLAPFTIPPTLGPGCGLTSRARHGQSVPGGGILSPAAWGTSAVVNASGRIAFFAQVLGSTRNQGIFTADGSTLTSVARGCGGSLGSGGLGATCGDPTPIGGTFGGFLTGSTGTPAINDAGDVLFLADVVGGSSTIMHLDTR